MISLLFIIFVIDFWSFTCFIFLYILFYTRNTGFWLDNCRSRIPSIAVQNVLVISIGIRQAYNSKNHNKSTFDAFKS
jgi:energy-coupling factor transporter transmembrane protein EcfT